MALSLKDPAIGTIAILETLIQGVPSLIWIMRPVMKMC